MYLLHILLCNILYLHIQLPIVITVHIKCTVNIENKN